MQAYLILANGRILKGKSLGCQGTTVGEVVFATGMVGFEETLTDPSYYGQIITQTYPLIGNYGMTDEDYETKTPTIGGMIVREYNDSPSNFRYTKTLNEVFEEHDIPGYLGRRYPRPDAHHPRRGDPEGDRHRRRDAPRRGPAQIAGVRHAA